MDMQQINAELTKLQKQLQDWFNSLSQNELIGYGAIIFGVILLIVGIILL